MTYVVLAGNHGEFQEWLEKEFVYAGDFISLNKLDPSCVKEVLFVGDYRRHPLYWTDDFLRFQMKVAFANQELREHWWHRFLRRIGYAEFLST